MAEEGHERAVVGRCSLEVGDVHAQMSQHVAILTVLVGRRS